MPNTTFSAKIWKHMAEAFTQLFKNKKPEGKISLWLIFIFLTIDFD